MLANWMFFWDEADWQPATPEAEEAPSSAGHGKKSNDYLGADADFWLVREKHLRRFIEPIERERSEEKTQETIAEAAGKLVPKPGAGMALLQRALDNSLRLAREADNLAALLDATANAQRLALDISNFRQQYYDRATVILLLDVI